MRGRRGDALTHCNWCPTEIMWLTMPSGARMPVDAKPDLLRGNVRRNGGRGFVVTGAELETARRAGAPLRLPHAATCPNAYRWSKRPKAAKPKVQPQPSLFDGAL